MLDSSVLNETLKKKNKEIELLAAKNEEIKKEYEMKAKNLMGSIATLQKQNRDLENQSKDNVRVEIIKNLKQERKDQEQVITLLRKYIANELEVDKYLLNNFKKSGEMHLATYEELKILNKQLQSKLTELKLKSSASPISAKTRKDSKVNTGMDDSVLNQKIEKKIMKIEEEKRQLQEENEALKESKGRMEAMQTEIFNKLKTYNKEIGEMKSIYDVIRAELEEENSSKMATIEAKVKRMELENAKYIEKINELIKIGSEREKELLIKIKQLQRDNEVMSKLLVTKKNEIEVYNEEISKYKNQLDNFDIKDVSRQRRIGEEKVSITRKNNELEEQIIHLETVIKQKDAQIANFQSNIELINGLMEEKNMEIELYTDKIKELEEIKAKSNK